MDWYDRDRTHIRFPFMEGCDPSIIKKQNERIKRLELRKRWRKEKYALIALQQKQLQKIMFMINKKRRRRYG